MMLVSGWGGCAAVATGMGRSGPHATLSTVAGDRLGIRLLPVTARETEFLPTVRAVNVMKAAIILSVMVVSVGHPWP